MKAGDMVRFALWEEVDISDSASWHATPKKHIGVLIDHDKLLGVVNILYKGEVHKIRACLAEKSGRRDITSEGTET